MYEDGGFVTEERFSTWQKKKVRTIIVNAHSKNPAQRSIGNAVNIAKPYDRIELTGGDYNESVTIGFPLEIVAGEGEEPHIVSRNTGITFTANVEAYLENLVITSKGNTRLDAAVAVMSGTPVIFRCNLNSVIIGGTGAPTIEKCTITESAAGFGLIVQDAGGGTVTGTSIFYHTNACVDIDTKGELLVSQCNLHNCKLLEGDVVRVSAASSGAASESDKVFPACRRVEVTRCQIYVNDEDPNIGRNKQRQIPQIVPGTVRNSVGTCCCVVVSSNAKPTFSSNEFLEGEIGFLFDDSGAAVVRGNVIRCQRRCGVLALVEEGYSYIKGRESLRITGDNVLDRCLVGIDVQCMTSRGTLATIPTEDKIISNEYPIPKRAFRWINNPKLIEDADGEKSHPFEDGKQHTLLLPGGGGAPLSVTALRDQLRRLAQLILQVHTTCLSQQFTYATTSGTSFVPSGAPGSVVDRSAYANVLNNAVGSTLSADLCDRQPSSAVLEQVLQLRGNQGVDIERTKFSSCGLCAIRFGRQGYGLVEDCTFDNCGTHAVVIESAAHPLITGCRFMRSNDTAILVGNYANPFIIGNEIAQGRVGGVEVSGHSMGIIMGNTIASNQGAGVSLHSGSSSILCANLISLNRAGGITADDSSPVIIFNSLSGNAEAQVGCTEYADAFIGYNTIQSSQHIGIHLAKCSRCRIVQNEVSKNGEGVVVELDADPYVERNKINENIRLGVRTANNGIGSFVDNEIHGNNGPNVLVLEGASPNFRRNSIRKSAQGGIVVALEGTGYFEKNSVAENSIANVIVADPFSNPVLVNNSLFLSASGCGVICGKECGGVFKRNKISENRACGVYVYGAANPTMRGNTVARESVGIIFSNAGKGVFEDNIVESCFGAGVISQHEGEATFTRNVVRRCGGSGFLITAEGRGVFAENELYENGIGVQLGCGTETAPFQFDSPYLDGNGGGFDHDSGDGGSRGGGSASSNGAKRHRRSSTVFSPSTQKSYLQNFIVSAGARRATQAKPTTAFVRQCKIYKNKSAGVLIDLDASAVLEDNDIYENSQYGVLGDSEFCAEWAKKTVADNAGTNSNFRPIELSAPRPPPETAVTGVLSNNKIHSHTVANVYFVRLTKTDTCFRGNEIYDAPMGVYVGNYSQISLMDGNTIHHCLDGVYGESGGGGTFTGNHIKDCRFVGVYVSDFAEPTWGERNIIETCGVCGIMVDAGGRGHFSHCNVKRCAVGVMVFSGATAAFHTSYDEIVKANLVSSYATLEDNVIEENETHGILVVVVLSGCPLRVSRRQMNEEPLGEFDHYKPQPSDGGVKVAHAARGERLCTIFTNNTIRRNRMFGVYMDQFDHWDLDALDKAHAEQSKNRATSMQNAYGGYEVLLGTSQVLDSPEHHKERERKQVTFTGNTISECSFGFGAGYGCHPFLCRNKILKNSFFGLFLRFGSAVMSHGSDIGENGIAGVYASLGAKGFVTRGVIFGNNGFSRAETKRSAPRNFSEQIFSQKFLAPPNGDSCSEFEEGTTRMFARAYEQMENYIDVVGFLVTKGIRSLCEMVSASSDAMSLATGCVPSSTFLGGSSVTRSLGVAGLALADYIHVCPADGGIGVWIEDDARTTIKDNIIREHKNFGVFVSKGVPAHHKILSTPTFSVTPITPDPSLFNIMDTANDYLAQPALACAEPYVLFSPFGFCASGVVAAMQVAAAYAVFDYGLDTFNGSALGPSTPATAATPRVGASGGGARDDTSVLESKDQKLDSIHFAHVVGNTIAQNRNGVGIELYHLLNAKKNLGLPPTSPAAGSNSTATSAPTKDANTAAQLDAADYAIMEPITEPLDFTVVLDSNKVCNNTKHGLLCQHVVQVYCGDMISNAGELSTAVTKQYDISLSSYGKDRPSLAFTVTPVTRRITHAMLQKNELFENGSYQAEVTSRYVAITADKMSTLLQYDTLNSPESSQYSSQVLLGTSILASLTQLPPPGVLVLDNNTIRDSAKGVHLSGVLGSRSVRLTNNRLTSIRETALLSEGHMSCVTVGGGNVFEGNTVAVHLKSYTFFPESVYGSLSSSSASASSPSRSALLADRRTRVFQNVFKKSKSASILMSTVGCSRVLCYQNELIEHGPGSTGFFLDCDSDVSDTVLSGNIFRSSFLPVIVSGGHAKNAALFENYYIGNYMGTLVCNGAAPYLFKEFYENNQRSGLEVVGARTHPVVESCVFRGHVRPANAPPPATTAAASDNTEAASTEQAVYTFPADGIVRLERQPKFMVQLVPENGNVLGPNSNVRLPAGLLLDPAAEGQYKNCVFHNNDVGIDAVRELASTGSGGTGVFTPQARFQACFFRASRVAGVLTRGNTAVSANGGKPQRSESTTKNTTAVAGAGKAPQTAAVADAKRGSVDLEAAVRDAAETTVFEKCFFVNNNNNENCGDAITMASGHATFRKNVFCGTVHARFDGLAHFTENSFFPYDASPSPNTALVCHQGSKMTFSRNIIVQRKVGVFAAPGSGGSVTGNTLVQCTTGLSLAPFCSVVCSKNRIILSGDCAVLAFGGVVTENEVFKAPTGVIIQNPYTYKGINAIPMNMRVNPQIVCNKNTVTACAADGVLVAGVGTVAANVITKCRNGVTVVSGKSSEGVPGESPRIQENNVFDNVVGINIDDKAACVVENNDVFDNDSMGVVCNISATGELRGNRISSAGDQGAVDIPIDSQIKANSNVIRNQFSPAYNRGIRTNRQKEYSVKLESVSSEVDGYEQLVDVASTNAEAMTNATDALIQNLLALHAKAANMQTLAGPISRSLRRSSGSVAFPTVDVKSLADVPPPSTKSGKGSGGGGNRRSSVIALASTSKVSNTATLARKKVAGGSKRGSQPLVPALIHVMSATSMGAAAATGQSVAQVFASAPMSSMNLKSTVTTTSAQLTRLLEAQQQQYRQGPLIVLLVLDPSYVSKITDADRGVLAKLQSVVSPRREALNVGFVVMPESCSLTSPELTKADGGMSFAAFCEQQHGTVTYASGVEDALDALKREMSAAIKKHNSGASEQSEAVDDEPESLMATMAGADTAGLLSEDEIADAATAAPSPHAEPSSKRTFSREYIGGLLSQLSPEALGITSDKSGATPAKRRKTSGRRVSTSANKKRTGSVSSTRKASSGSPSGATKKRKKSVHK